MAEIRPAIVTVDDEPEVLLAISRDLRKRYGKEYRVLRAGSASEALAAVEELAAKEEPIALLLSDQRMPDLDGVGFLSEAMERVPDAKRALLTAYADTEAAISAINRSQVDYYLTKPWDPPEERLYPIIDDLLQTWRRAWRPGYGGIKVAGHRWSPETHRIKDFLARNHIPYRFYDVESTDEGRALAGDRSLEQLPTVVLTDGQRLDGPDVVGLANALGLRMSAAEQFYDVAIVGGGPAGLASAVYGASEGLRTVLLERDAPGGQAGTSSRIENYLGFPNGLSGGDLAQRAVTQAKRFGVEMLVPQTVESLEIDGPYRRLTLGDGSTISSHALMLAMGVSWRQLQAPGAAELTGRGVYYGAAMTEAASCRNEQVYIVGAGNSAGQAAMYFADYADHVHIVLRGPDLGAKMSHYLVERILAHPKMTVLTHTEIDACHGVGHLERLTLRNNQTGEQTEVPANYVFIFIGAAPRTDWLPAAVARDDRGFVKTGPDLTEADLAVWPLPRRPFLLEASVPGVFAVGDVRATSVKRVASAVGEGSVAISFAHQHLASL